MRALLAALVLVLALAAIPAPGSAYTPSSVEPDPFLAGNVTIGEQLAAYGRYDYTDDQTGQATLAGFVADARVAEPFNLSWTKVRAPGVLQENAIGTKRWTGTENWTVLTTGTAPTCTLSQDTVDGSGKALRFKSVAAGGLGSCDWAFDVDPDLTADVDKTRFVVGVDVLVISTEPGFLQASGGGGASNYFIHSIYTTLGCIAGESLDWRLAKAAGVSVFEQQPLKRPCGGVANPPPFIAQVRIGLQVKTGETFEIRLTALDFRAAAHSLGTRGGGAAATNQTQAMGGGVGVAVLAPTFAYTRLGDVKIAFRQLASTLPADQASATYDAGARVGSYRFDFRAPTAIDLAYGAIVADDPLRVDGGQILSATWGGEDITALYQGKDKGDVVRVRSSVAAGAASSLQLDVQFSESEWDEVGGGGGGFEFGGLRTGVTIAVLVGGALLAAVILARRFRKKGRREKDEMAEFLPLPLLPLQLGEIDTRMWVGLAFIVVIFALFIWLLLRGGLLAGTAAPIRRESERMEARSARDVEAASRARVRRLEVRAREGEARRTSKPPRRSRRRALAVAVVLAAVASVAVAAAIARPIEPAGEFRVLSHPCSKDIITCGFEDVIQAVTNGFRRIIDAAAGVFVSIFNALGAALATVIEMFIVSPWRFFSAAFDEAIRGIQGLGLAAPWATLIVLLGSFALLVPAVILLRAAVGAAIPGELEEIE